MPKACGPLLTRTGKNADNAGVFKQKRKDKLTAKEIEAAVARLRQGHDDYIIKYMQPMTEKTAFEDRYIVALHSRLDLTRFIRDEMVYLEGLNREQQEAQEEAKRASQVAEGGRSFADRVLEEMERKIETYPELDFHEEAPMEIRKLYGALAELDQTHWSVLASFIRKVYSTTVSYSMENRLLRMTAPAGRDVPPELDRYFFLLNKRDARSSELFQEAQECIKRASFFLHELRHILEEYKERKMMDAKVEAAYTYIENVINDFRLKDLKRL